VSSAVWGKVPFLPSVCQPHCDQVFVSGFDSIHDLVVFSTIRSASHPCIRIGRHRGQPGAPSLRSNG